MPTARDKRAATLDPNIWKGARMKNRSAQATIDLVLHENQVLSVTLYVVAALSVLGGITVLGVALWRNQPITAVAGVVETYLTAVLPQGLVGFAGDWSNRPVTPRQTR